MGLEPDEKGQVRAGSRSGVDHILSDIGDRPKVASTHKSSAAAAAFQFVFGYVGGGYFYLEDNVKALLSAVFFIGGVGAIVYVEMVVFPSSGMVNEQLMGAHYMAVGLLLVLVVLYFASVFDCYRIGVRVEKDFRGYHGHEVEKPRECTIP
ncbi:MAG: hypothetical protein V1744_00285 [Candidatus Altiarchaeota archaeon]